MIIKHPVFGEYRYDQNTLSRALSGIASGEAGAECITLESSSKKLTIEATFHEANNSVSWLLCEGLNFWAYQQIHTALPKYVEAYYLGCKENLLSNALFQKAEVPLWVEHWKQNDIPQGYERLEVSRVIKREDSNGSERT